MRRRGLGPAVMAALFAVAGCTPSEITLSEPGEAERLALQARLTTQTDVGSPTSISVGVLHAVVSRATPSAAPELTLIPNPDATLPRLGRLTSPLQALARPGSYFSVSNIMGEIVFLVRVGEGAALIGEGLTPTPEEDPSELEGTLTTHDRQVVSSRIPLELGGKFSVFITGEDPGDGSAIVEDLLLVVPFGPDDIPRRGRRYRVVP